MPLDAPPRRLEANGSALADEVYDLLARAILDGSLAAGERVRDVELARLLGISRTPVREAMQRLERQGLVEVAAHRYTRVRSPDPALTGETVEFIGYLAGIGLRLGLPRMGDEEHAAAVILADAMVDASVAGDDDALMRTSYRFYEAVTVTTENRLYIAVLKESGVSVQKFLGGWRPMAEDAAARTDSYRRLSAAVAARDGERAEAIVRAQHGLG